MANTPATAEGSFGRSTGLPSRAEKPRWLELGLIAAFWGVAGLLTVAQQALDPRFGDQGGLQAGETLYTLLVYVIWAALTPGVFWLSRRFSLEHRRWLWHLLLHVLVAVVAAVIVDLISHALWNALVQGSRRSVSLGAVLSGFHVLAEVLLYLTVLMAGFAWDYFLRYREGQEEAVRLQEESHRKTLELEQARQLQLSMLPETTPSLPGLDIAVHMQTATEVGGDYYDFHVDAAGVLTVGVGDATGHGLQAGVVVAITKGLFRIMAEEPDLLEIARKATRVIKGMGLPRLYMAMTLARLRGDRLQVVAAGMPMPLIYRGADGRVEELEVKGMPLGAFEQFPYQQREVQLREGDTVLLMSDGFPELFNAEGEMLGYARAKSLFGKIAGGAPSEVVRQLKQEVAAWSGGPPKDDVTFVVIGVEPTGARPDVTEVEAVAERESHLPPR